MKRIRQERLIELAESASDPTAEEKRILGSDAALASELHELRSILSELKELPEPGLPREQMDQILQGVQAGITEINRPVLSSLFRSRGPLMNFVAAAASLLLIIGLFFAIGNGSGDTVTPDLMASYNFATFGSATIETEALLLQASGEGEFDPFAEILDSVKVEANGYLIDESTSYLMDQAAQLDDDDFKDLVDTIRSNGL
jgi:hypothetical protein